MYIESFSIILMSYYFTKYFLQINICAGNSIFISTRKMKTNYKKLLEDYYILHIIEKT